MLIMYVHIGMPLHGVLSRPYANMLLIIVIQYDYVQSYDYVQL